MTLKAHLHWWEFQGQPHCTCLSFLCSTKVCSCPTQESKASKTNAAFLGIFVIANDLKSPFTLMKMPRKASNIDWTYFGFLSSTKVCCWATQGAKASMVNATVLGIFAYVRKLIYIEKNAKVSNINCSCLGFFVQHKICSYTAHEPRQEQSVPL